MSFLVPATPGYEIGHLSSFRRRLKSSKVLNFLDPGLGRDDEGLGEREYADRHYLVGHAAYRLIMFNSLSNCRPCLKI